MEETSHIWSIKKKIIYILFAIIFALIVVLLAGDTSEWGNENEQMMFDFLTMFTMIVCFLVYFDELRSLLLKHWIRTSFSKAILIGFSVGLIKISLANYIILRFPKVVHAGTDAYHGGIGNTLIEGLLVCVTGPFEEEVLFRLLIYAIIFSLVLLIFKVYSHYKKIHKIVLEERGKWIAAVIFVIVSSFVFGYLHEPSFSPSLLMYLVPGIIYSLLFLRYGLLSSFAAHITNNTFSSLTFMLFLQFFN
ncbi:CPBP family intramembrane glutamic endopeptidase [Gottfriedia acidiceleris]|uniref:CPBP family intramembrane glutamic endopeptidase n=1 Tax=Gottfriedia acidiceleris TaxID=371036 RepID=UPI00101B93CE|nr:CPBP family intramembrane glutamic endopeptidase [Gottfriedia acidiceleris]